MLVVFAIPTGARLIAERVRAVGRTGFVAASRGPMAQPTLILFATTSGRTCVEDVAWIVASVFPASWPSRWAWRTSASSIVTSRDWDGLLAKSFNNLSVGTAVFQMLVTIVVILWVALLPQIMLRALGVRASREFAP